MATAGAARSARRRRGTELGLTGVVVTHGRVPFDVVSKIDAQELDNALNQVRKEIAGRFDFKNSKTTIENTETDITIVADDELKLKNVIDIVQARPSSAAFRSKPSTYGNGAGRPDGSSMIAIRAGIPKDKIKPLIDAIKAAKLRLTLSSKTSRYA